MKNSLSFFYEFIHRKGAYVFGATLIARLLSFLASWISLKLIPEVELGYAIYAFYIISFIVPLAGFGSSQGLLRYGAKLSGKTEKDQLFVYILKKGTLYTFLLILIVLLISSFLTHKIPDARCFLILFSFSIYSFFLLDILKIQFRVNHNNKTYAAVEIVYNILFVIFIYIFSYFYKATGYSIAFIITPIITFLLFYRQLNINWRIKIKPKLINASFWKYSFFASLAVVSSQLLFAIDIILIGMILQNATLVTTYRYILLVPFSFLILTRVVMTTDFVVLTKNINSKNYIIKYIKNYTIYFLIISLLLIGFSFVFGKYILQLFKKEYEIYDNIFLLLTIAISGILLLRGLFDNLLSALGKATIIYFISVFGLVTNYLLNIYLIPKYGIEGAAITTLITMWSSGFLSFFIFLYYYRKQKFQ